MASKVMAALALTAALVSASVDSSQDSTRANVPAQYEVLNGADQPLRNDFNRDHGYVRLIFLVDPICPGCLRGMADMGDDLLSKLPQGARVKVYVVYESVLGGKEIDIAAAAELLRTTRARHYWNPSGDFGRQMSHALGYWNGSRWVYAWDTWLIYAPDVVWNGSIPPQPAFLMHQLGALDNSPKFPHLDSKVFAAKVNAMLAAKAAAQ